MPKDPNDLHAFTRFILNDRVGEGLSNFGSTPWTCELCPWEAETREPLEQIWNDEAEAHYKCPVLGREVWGENPECAEHMGKMLRRVVEIVDRASAPTDIGDTPPAPERAKGDAVTDPIHPQQETMTMPNMIRRLPDHWTFDAAFEHARRQELKSFQWRDRLYHTKTEEEEIAEKAEAEAKAARAEQETATARYIKAAIREEFERRDAEAKAAREEMLKGLRASVESQPRPIKPGPIMFFDEMPKGQETRFMGEKVESKEDEPDKPTMTPHGIMVEVRGFVEAALDYAKDLPQHFRNEQMKALLRMVLTALDSEMHGEDRK